ncbi:hypothetical protein BLNAU_8973 [Blattamonas nauphoetae]|uniref:SPRY domain-containing protein n=1 Tax=Blattamonas nauphoetae TaxID=2049346 RepID=A0ABQ9XWX2_9EUKA|nr:hypothetical protein BLNAU_8973 [Blattamonas nauphoetae]
MSVPNITKDVDYSSFSPDELIQIIMTLKNEVKQLKGENQTLKQQIDHRDKLLLEKSEHLKRIVRTPMISAPQPVAPTSAFITFPPLQKRKSMPSMISSAPRSPPLPCFKGIDLMDKMIISSTFPQSVHITRSTCTALETSDVGITLKVNPPFSAGMIRCEFAFDNTSGAEKSVGIIESGFHFTSDHTLGLDNASIAFCCTGEVFHVPSAETEGSVHSSHSGDSDSDDEHVVENEQLLCSEKWDDGDIVALQVDYSQAPPTLSFFINDVKQLVHYINIPDSIVFAADFCTKDASLEIKALRQLVPPAGPRVELTPGVDWITGKQ